VQADIEALRVVIPLLDGEKQPAPQASAAEEEDNRVSEGESQRDEGPALSSLVWHRTRLWKRRR